MFVQPSTKSKPICISIIVVAHDDVSFYMQNHVSSYRGTYTQNNIYIHMQVPISDHDIIYEIYQTNVLPHIPL